MDEHIRYMRQHALEGVGEAGQKLFFLTRVVCEGEGPVLQTAAAYLEAAGFQISRRATRVCPGFVPLAWQSPPAGKPPAPPPAKAFCRQSGFLGQLPCARPEGFDFWVLLGCLQGRPAFLFARGENPKPLLLSPLQEAAPGPAHFVAAAWAALVFEKLALGLGPEAGGGSIGPLGEAKLWGPP